MTVPRDITKIIDNFNDVPDGRNVQADLSRLALAFLRGTIDGDDFMEEEVLDLIGLDLSRRPSPSGRAILLLTEEGMRFHREEAVRYVRQLCANVVDFSVWAFDAAAHYQMVQLLNAPDQE